ncbi:hypothetical protein Tco_0532941 [Tanacetum coccineum]
MAEFDVIQGPHWLKPKREVTRGTDKKHTKDQLFALKQVQKKHGDSRRSGRRHGKEVVVEPDNDDKYIDVNNETSGDDFVDLGRNSAYGSGKKSLHGYLDNDLICDGIHYKGEIQARKRSRETSMSKAGIKTLKPNQKACLEETRFGSMVEFKVDGILGKLGLYVVDNFDGDNMEIKLSKGCIVLTKDMIGEMLGLKNEGLDILECNPNRDDEMVRNWKQQYGDAREPGDPFEESNGDNNTCLLTNHDSFTDIVFKSNIWANNQIDYNGKRRARYVETNILDTWAVVRNHMEEYRSNDSPFRLFLPTFVVDKDSFSQIRNHDGRFEIGAQHVESVVLHVFLPVDNEGHRFVLTFDLKYGAGFGHGELEEDFVEEDGDPIPNNIEVEALNDYRLSSTKNMKRLKLATLDDIACNEQTPLVCEESKVFLPVDNEGHRFVLTFDLKYGAGTKCKDNIVCRRRPPTKVWTVELLSDREDR